VTRVLSHQLRERINGLAGPVEPTAVRVNPSPLDDWTPEDLAGAILLSKDSAPSAVKADQASMLYMATEDMMNRAHMMSQVQPARQLAQTVRAAVRRGRAAAGRTLGHDPCGA